MAKHVTQEEFGDFQFIVSVTNIFVQPLIISSLIVTKVGCNFSPETRINNLRWFFQQKRVPLAVTIVLLLIFSYLIDPWLTKLGGIDAAGSFTIVGFFIASNVLYFYYIGFLQVLESFRSIGLLLSLEGIIRLALGLATAWMGLGILYFYATQATSFTIFVIVMIAVINHQLPKEAIPPSTDNSIDSNFSILIFLSIVSFFILYNMDIVVTKLLFDRVQAGYYARIELIGKISFILSSSIAMIIFPRASKIYGQGKDPISYLIRGTGLYFSLSLLMIVSIFMFSGEIFQYIFSEGLSGSPFIILLIVTAKIFQSYIFILINYEGAVIDRWMTYLLGGLLLTQCTMFSLNNTTLQQVAINILVPSVLGSFVLLGRVIYKRGKTMPALNSESDNTVDNG